MVKTTYSSDHLRSAIFGVIVYCNKSESVYLYAFAMIKYRNSSLVLEWGGCRTSIQF